MADGFYGLVNIVGRQSPGLGEKFNDYLQNKTFGEYSSAFGKNNIAGHKHYHITGPINDNNEIVIGTSVNEETGQVRYELELDTIIPSSVEATTAIVRYNSWYYCSNLTIEETQGQRRKVVFECPYGGPRTGTTLTKSQDEPDNSVFMFIDEPLVGNHDLGLSAFVGGHENIAANEGSVSFGENNKAYGNNSIAIGRENFVVYQGIALGRGNQTYKETGIGIGLENILTNQISVGLGRRNRVSGQYGVAIGNSNEVISQAGIALGNNSKVESGGRLALGWDALSNSNTLYAIGANKGEYYFEIGSESAGSERQYARNYLGLDPTRLNLGVTNIVDKPAISNTNPSPNSNRYNIAIGKNNENKGRGSILIGANNKTENADFGIAFGEGLTLKGDNSILIGHTDNIATGNCNISIGRKTVTNGSGSIALGWENQATANFSTAFGKDNRATAQGQFVIGTRNKINNKALFIVGNGNPSSTEDSNRSNAFWVNKTGTAEIGYDMASNYAKFLENPPLISEELPDLTQYTTTHGKENKYLMTIEYETSIGNNRNAIDRVQCYSTIITKESGDLIVNDKELILQFNSVLSPTSNRIWYYSVSEEEITNMPAIKKVTVLALSQITSNGSLATTGWVQAYLTDLSSTQMPLIGTNLNTTAMIAEASAMAWSGNKTGEDYEKDFFYYDQSGKLEVGEIKIPKDFTEGIQSLIDSNVQTGSYYNNGVLKIEHGGTGINSIESFIRKNANNIVDTNNFTFSGNVFKFTHEDQEDSFLIDTTTNGTRVIIGNPAEEQPLLFLLGKDNQITRGLIITENGIYKHYGEDNDYWPTALKSSINSAGNLRQIFFGEEEIIFERPVKFNTSLSNYNHVGRPRKLIFSYQGSYYTNNSSNNSLVNNYGYLASADYRNANYKSKVNTRSEVYIQNCYFEDNEKSYHVYEIHFQGLNQSIIANRVSDGTYVFLRGLGGGVNRDNNGRAIIACVDFQVFDMPYLDKQYGWLSVDYAYFYYVDNPSKIYHRPISYIYGIA